MKKSLAVLAGVVLIGLSSSAFADGKKIYDRAFGRGCGACHDVASNPQLSKLIKEGKLDEAKFTEVLTNGRGGMPKAIDEIKKIAKIQDGDPEAAQQLQAAIDELYAYLKLK